MTCIAYMSPDVPYCPLLYPSAALLRFTPLNNIIIISARFLKGKYFHFLYQYLFRNLNVNIVFIFTQLISFMNNLQIQKYIHLNFFYFDYPSSNMWTFYCCKSYSAFFNFIDEFAFFTAQA